jgi:hypothetical protein
MDATISQITKIEKSKLKAVFKTDWVSVILYFLGLAVCVMASGCYVNAFFTTTQVKYDYQGECLGLLLMVISLMTQQQVRWKKLQNFLESEFKE